MKRGFGLLIILVLALLGFGWLAVPRAAATDEADTSILVIVNEDTIHTSDLDQEIMRRHASMTDSTMKSFDFRKLLGKMVDDR
ncbi:MAG TPA: hypothetical protein VJ983_05185, partial [candidate division Zixibacteria bacterium]|nr:hypothetical protein [candidate division Zixibacteria bacterium]